MLNYKKLKLGLSTVWLLWATALPLGLDLIGISLSQPLLSVFGSAAADWVLGLAAWQTALLSAAIGLVLGGMVLAVVAKIPKLSFLEVSRSDQILNPSVMLENEISGEPSNIVNDAENAPTHDDFNQEKGGVSSTPPANYNDTTANPEVVETISHQSNDSYDESVNEEEKEEEEKAIKKEDEKLQYIKSTYERALKFIQARNSKKQLVSLKLMCASLSAYLALPEALCSQAVFATSLERLGQYFSNLDNLNTILSPIEVTYIFDSAFQSLCKKFKDYLDPKLEMGSVIYKLPKALSEYIGENSLSIYEKPTPALSPTLLQTAGKTVRKSELVYIVSEGDLDRIKHWNIGQLSQFDWQDVMIVASRSRIRERMQSALKIPDNSEYSYEVIADYIIKNETERRFKIIYTLLEQARIEGKNIVFKKEVIEAAKEEAKRWGNIPLIRLLEYYEVNKALKKDVETWYSDELERWNASTKQAVFHLGKDYVTWDDEIILKSENFKPIQAIERPRSVFYSFYCNAKALDLTNNYCDRYVEVRLLEELEFRVDSKTGQAKASLRQVHSYKVYSLFNIKNSQKNWAGGIEFVLFPEMIALFKAMKLSVSFKELFVVLDRKTVELLQSEALENNQVFHCVEDNIVLASREGDLTSVLSFLNDRLSTDQLQQAVIVASRSSWRTNYGLRSDHRTRVKIVHALLDRLSEVQEKKQFSNDFLKEAKIYATHSGNEQLLSLLEFYSENESVSSWQATVVSKEEELIYEIAEVGDKNSLFISNYLYQLYGFFPESQNLHRLNTSFSSADSNGTRSESDYRVAQLDPGSWVEIAEKLIKNSANSANDSNIENQNKYLTELIDVIKNLSGVKLSENKKENIESVIVAAGLVFKNYWTFIQETELAYDVNPYDRYNALFFEAALMMADDQYKDQKHRGIRVYRALQYLIQTLEWFDDITEYEDKVDKDLGFALPNLPCIMHRFMLSQDKTTLFTVEDALSNYKKGIFYYKRFKDGCYKDTALTESEVQYLSMKAPIWYQKVLGDQPNSYSLQGGNNRNNKDAIEVDWEEKRDQGENSEMTQMEKDTQWIEEYSVVSWYKNQNTFKQPLNTPYVFMNLLSLAVAASSRYGVSLKSDIYAEEFVKHQKETHNHLILVNCSDKKANPKMEPLEGIVISASLQHLVPIFDRFSAIDKDYLLNMKASRIENTTFKDVWKILTSYKVDRAHDQEAQANTDLCLNTNKHYMRYIVRNNAFDSSTQKSLDDSKKRYYNDKKAYRLNTKKLISFVQKTKKNQNIWKKQDKIVSKKAVKKQYLKRNRDNGPTSSSELQKNKKILGLVDHAKFSFWQAESNIKREFKK